MATDLRTRARRALPCAAVVAGVAVVLRLVFDPWYLNYDARYALLWARDAVEGFTPDYTADFAPTPHPLETALSVLALPFGDGGDQLMVWLVLACFGLVVWLVYRLGSELFSPGVGVVAAVVVATRPSLLRDATLGYQDVAFAALILFAVLLESRRPRRGAVTIALLVIAGLMRPEAWVLSGMYLLWLSRSQSVRSLVPLGALALLSPVLWASMDWAVTGDALHSLHGTSDLAEAVDRRRDVVSAPYWAAKYFGSTLREPLVVGIPLGLWFAWRHRRGTLALPLAVVVAMVLVFMAGPIFGLPLIGRYVRTPAMLLAIFYGAAVLGFRLLDADDPERRRWLAVGVFAAALSVAFLPWHARMVDNLRERTQRNGDLYRDLRAVGYAPEVRAAYRDCGRRLTTADHRPIPYLRYWLHGDPDTIGTVAQNASPLSELLLLPRRTRLPRAFYRTNFPRVAPPPGWRVVYSNRSFRVYASPECQPG